MRYFFTVLAFKKGNGNELLWRAWQNEDLDKNNEPKPGTAEGKGETPLAAIADLCCALECFELNETPDELWPTTVK